MFFANRSEAGRRLAERLVRFADRSPVVLALVRGGLPVGFEVARALRAPLDIVLVRKIGAPNQPELAAGAIADGPTPETVLNADVCQQLDLPADFIERAARQELAEIERRRALYLRGRPRAEIEGKTAIVIDDGIATGATTRAALRTVRRQKPSALVLAVPVAPQDTLAALEGEADEIVCLATPEPFGAIGAFYRDFRQVSDTEVIEMLDRARRWMQHGAAAP